MELTFGDILLLYAIGLVAFLIIDLVWLGVFAKDWYARQLGDLKTPNIRWGGAILFYLLYVGGLMLFAIVPGIFFANLLGTLTLAALYGFFTYMTYDLTNYATLRRWPLQLVVVDITWGVVLSSGIALCVYGASLIVL